jgi:hypothetical protein
MIATNTLAQGVNLPVRTIVVHSVWRYIRAEGHRKRIPARDFWNIAGRAGRAGEETEGLIVHIALNDLDNADFEHYLNARENLEEVQSSLFTRLNDLVAGRLTQEALQADIDPEILAILAEEDIEASIQDSFDNTISRALVGIQAARRELPTAELVEAMTSWAIRLANQIPDQEHRTVFSSTGLSSKTCRILFDNISEDPDHVRTILTEETEVQLDEILDVILPVCLSLVEMQPDREFGGSVIDLVKDWVGGVDIRRITSKFGSQARSAEAFGRFVDELIRYRLPWGVSGYIRIACLALGLEREALSFLARFLPNMIKFGLPDPFACWVMSAGVPYRSTALLMSDAFTKEVALTDYHSFRSWLGTLSSERLGYDFQLSSPILEDVGRSISVASVNEHLWEFEGLPSFLPIEVGIRGIAYENRQVTARRAREGMNVRLLRDFDNLVDRNAIVVELRGNVLGYIPREVAQVLAPEMDTGAVLQASISSVEYGRLPRISIHISMATAL